MAKKNTIILRKKKKDLKIGDITDGDKFRMIKDYRTKSYSELEKIYHVSPERLKKWFSEFFLAMDNARETKQLMRGHSYTPKEHPQSNNKGINEHFLSLLSDEDSDMLNEAENTYVMEWVSCGNNGKALTTAKLDLEKDGKPVTNRFLKSARGKYLRNRDKMKKAIKREEQVMLDEMASSKEFLQRTLIQTIRELQEDVGDNRSNRNNLLKSIELLGKTIPGSFTETVRTEEVSPKNTLQLLMKKVNERKAIEERGTETEELEGGTYHTT